jgi:transcriptional regulator with XRE-family HTH domain
MLSLVKTRERELARRLRREEGESIKVIARRVGVSVSSVSIWVRDIDLTDEQEMRLRLQNRIYDGLKRGRAIASANRRAERVAAQQEGRAAARRGEPLHVAGCMLYWAEGSKFRNAVRLSNSDPEMAKLFVKFLRTYFDEEADGIRLTCHLFADHQERQREIEDFWLDALDLSRTALCRSIVNVYSRHSQRKRMNMLPYGTCRVVLSRTRVIQHIFGAIQEYAGFHREAWLE